jgi:guanylate kinase
LSRQLALRTVSRFWRKCELPGQPDFGEIPEGYTVRTSSSLNHLKALWGMMVYGLCAERSIPSALEMPFLEIDGHAVIWISDTAVVFGNHPSRIQLPNKPKIVHPVMVAIGGPSGAGKTSVIKRMKARSPDMVFTSPAYTTRPQRPGEQDGVDYFFMKPADLEAARQDPRFINFVEARGAWYWISPSVALDGVWGNPDRIHVGALSQVQEFQAQKAMFPDNRWIWLTADPDDLRRRLEDSGDRDVTKSLAYNDQLRQWEPGRVGLIDLVITTRADRLDDAVDQVFEFCAMLQKRRKL